MSAVPQVLPGINGGCYKNTGTYGTPVWADQTSVKNAKLAFPWDFVEALSRQYPVKLYAKSLIDVPVEIVMRADPADAIYAAWVAASFGRTTVLDLMVLNSKITTQGCVGIRGEYLLSLTGEPQEENGTVYSTFELKPALTANGVPQWVTMGASSTPAFTAITY